MPKLKEEPLFTATYSPEQRFTPVSGSTYFYGPATEERGQFVSELACRSPNVQFAEVVSVTPEVLEVRFHKQASETVRMRSNKDLGAIFGRDGGDVYVDMTSMTHAVWAVLVRGAHSSGRATRVVYTEPEQYPLSESPTEGNIFDLSERVEGIAALPGFVRLPRFEEEPSIFVPLLGFEGTRFLYLHEHVQPNGDAVVPIVGVPGFRVEFPYFTYLGNRTALIETRAWRRVRYAKANCPFSLFYLLVELAAECDTGYLKVAPIGTKPHALGAVLFAIAHAERIELIYDNPVRKAGRSVGRSRVLVYYVSEFMRE